MHCRICYKPAHSAYHELCLQKLIGSTEVPRIPFSAKQTAKLAERLQSKGVEISSNTDCLPMALQAINQTYSFSLGKKERPFKLQFGSKSSLAYEDLLLNIFSLFGIECAEHGLFQNTQGEFVIVRNQQPTPTELIKGPPSFKEQLELLLKSEFPGYYMILWTERSLLCLLLSGKLPNKIPLQGIQSIYQIGQCLDPEDLDGQLNTGMEQLSKDLLSYPISPKALENILERFKNSFHKMDQLINCSFIETVEKEKLSKSIGLNRSVLNI